MKANFLPLPFHAALAVLTLPLAAEPEEKEAAKWVKAHEAGYTSISGRGLGVGITDVEQAEFRLAKLPEQRITRFDDSDALDSFLEACVAQEGEDTKNDEGGQTGAFDPDFAKEIVIAISVPSSETMPSPFEDGKPQPPGKFMDIEVMRHEGHLSGYAFFHPSGFSDDDPVGDRLYLIAVPKEFADRDMEFRLAIQSWGRECSRFSPPIEETGTR